MFDCCRITEVTSGVARVGTELSESNPTGGSGKNYLHIAFTT